MKTFFYFAFSISVLSLASCSKKDELNTSPCKTYTVEATASTVVQYQDCEGRQRTIAFDQETTKAIDAEAGSLRKYELKHSVSFENSSAITIAFVDEFNKVTLKPESNQQFRSTGNYILTYDGNQVTNQHAALYVDGVQVEVRRLTDGTTKFFKPIQDEVVIKIIDGLPEVD